MATTNQSTSSSTQSVPAWMSRTWNVFQVDPNSSFGVVSPDTVTFTGTTVAIQHNIPGVLTSAQPWGTLDTITATQATGHTSQGSGPFLITYDASNDQLICTMEPATPQRQWRAVLLGTLSGALAGAVAGFLARSPLQGFLTGLLAASTGSLVTSRLGALNAVQTSTPTWVANDAGPGSVPKQPEIVPPIRATA